MLLELGANVDATNTITGATPLHCAVQTSKATPERRLATVQELMKAHANPSLGDFYGSIPLEYCEEEALQELLQPEVPAVFSAVRDRNINELECVLKQDATAVQCRHGDLTALLEVVNDLVEEDAHVYLEMMQLLLENGADPNATPTAKRHGHLTVQEKVGDIALHTVCVALKEAYREANDKRIELLESAARLLKEHESNVAPDTELLLHDAARRNEMGMIKFLIEDIGVSPNVAGRQGMTPLQFAARSGKTQVVEYLLAQDTIDVSVADERGQTALDAARLNAKDDIIALLELHSIE